MADSEPQHFSNQFWADLNQNRNNEFHIFPDPGIFHTYINRYGSQTEYNKEIEFSFSNHRSLSYCTLINQINFRIRKQNNIY